MADVVILSLLGITTCAYAYYVETRKEQDPSYRAMCDFNESMSCSRVLTSKYAKGFGVVEMLLGKAHFLNKPNSLLGMIFYVTQLLLSFIKTPMTCAVLFYTSLVSCVGSIYLAYILFVILKDVCVVCIATYIINGSLVYINYHNYMSIMNKQYLL